MTTTTAGIMGGRHDGISRRTFLLGAAGTLGAVALGGCGSSQLAATGTVRIQGGTFGFPSPYSYIAAPGYWRMSYLYDTLLWPDSTGELLPWLASRHQRSEDGLTHRLELREASWHDGRPLTARDVVFTFEYGAAQLASPLVIATPRHVASVAATGERSVQIRLDRPDPTFTKSVLGSLPIVPEHVWSKVDDAQGARDTQVLVGSGPYTLTQFSEADGRLLYEANDRYFLGKPFVRRIEMIHQEDELRAVRTGALDGGAAPVEGVRDRTLEHFRENGAFGLISQETGFAFPLFFNVRRGGALADPRFRRACLTAIDRDDLVARLLGGNGTVGNPGFLPPGHPYQVEVPQYPFDRGRAERLLDEAGYRRPAPGQPRAGPDGTPLRFELFVHDTVPTSLPKLVAGYLADVGLEVKQNVVDLVRLLGVKTQGSYDLLITLYPGPVGTTPNGDPELLRSVFHSKPPNQIYAAGGYANPEVDRLLERLYDTIDLEERREAVGEVQRIVAEDLPVAILYYTTMFFAFRRRTFDQWYYTPGGFGPGIPDAYNKHPFVTGRKAGLELRGAGG